MGISQEQRSGGALARRLGAYLALTAGEVDALDALETRPRAIARGRPIVRDSDRQGGFCVLRSGWAASALSLPDGRRQITRIHLPGELLGMIGRPAGGGDMQTAITDIEVCAIDRAGLSRLFEEHPRLGALLLQLTQVERLSLGDRLAAVGRTDARARLAGLILDLATRQRALDPALGRTVSLPMTQEEMGDAVGLTAVHVNRMMRQLGEGGLVARGPGGSMTLKREDALAELSGFVDRLSALDTDWLPAARG